MIIEINKKKVRVKFYADNIVRITVAPGQILPEARSLIVVCNESTPVIYKQTETPNDITFVTAKIILKLNKKKGTFTFADSKGKILLKEKSAKIKKSDIFGNKTFSIEENFALSKAEALFGLGQFQCGVMNWRGNKATLRQTNTGVAMPFLVSTGLWAILWDNYSETRFKDDNSGMAISSEAADAIDYYLITGDSMDELISGYRLLTGKTPMFGKWAYGYWQSKERYNSQNEVLKTALQFRGKKIPIDVIVQDWQYWGDNGHWNSMEFVKDRFPSPSKLTAKLHANNFKLMISFWPCFGKKTGIYTEMKKKGFIYEGVKHCWPPWADNYDAFNPEARQLYWKYINKNLFSKNIDCWWMDATEPEIFGKDLKILKTFYGFGAKYMNAYSLFTTMGVYEGQRSETDKKRVCILTRSGFPGQQRYASVTWSGDVSGTWEVYRRQIPAGLNFCMAGIPYWTTDIGGFFSMGGIHDGFAAEYFGGNQNESYRELYTRWFQYAAFCPVFRSHGTNTAREMWHFGKSGTPYYEAQKKIDSLRYRLLPYIYSLAWRVTDKNYTMMRGLAMDFCNDKKVYGIKNEFMFGNAFLVRPVTENLYTRDDGGGELIPAKFLFDNSGKNNGLDAQYYRTKDFTKPAISKKEQVLNFNWRQSPPEGCSTNFSARFSGHIKVPKTGDYEFTLCSDDKVRLWIADELLINRFKNPIYSAKIKLSANEKYPIRIEFSKSAWNSMLKLRWRTPDKIKMPGNPKVQDVYLPVGSKWYDFWTGKTYTGGRKIIANSPIDIIPLYVKAGSIVPMGPFLQYSTEKPADPIELRIYEGADGQFTLYEDENDNYNYEKGLFATIDLKWENRKRVLYIGQRNGSFKGMLFKRTFKIILVHVNHGTGLEITKKADKIVKYNGKPLKIKL